MPDRHHPDAVDLARARELEGKRTAYAAARIADHAERELVLLVRANQEPDDDAARDLLSEADTARRDRVALTKEHGLRR
jgi:hypothetical protein